MREGRLFAVVGASGVGKDTIMGEILAARPDMVWVRRAITRPAHPGDEPFEPVSDTEFDARLQAGDFALHWEAHGLRYGIPASLRAELSEGRDAMVNLSRHVLTDAAAVFPSLHILNITATDAVRADRLAARGRESFDDIARRIARVVPPFATGLRVSHIDNSGPLERSVAACLQLMDREAV